MIKREDVLSINFLRKSVYTGCCQGVRYRLERVEPDRLKVTVWPEPYNFARTPEEQKTLNVFEFSEDGVNDAIEWMNSQLSSGGVE